MKRKRYSRLYCILFLLPILVQSQEQYGHANASLLVSYPKDFPGIELPYDMVDRRIMTAIKFTVSPIAMFLHISILYIFFFSKNRNKYKNVFYRLVFVISCTDIYGCIWMMYTGLCHALGFVLFGEVGNIIITIGFQYIFFICMNMDLLIAFNRFSAVVLCKSYEKIFSTKLGMFYISLIILASTMECMPTFYYKKIWFPELETFSFYNKPPNDVARFIIWMELVCTYISHSLLAIFYTWSFYSMRQLTTKTATQKFDQRLLYQGLFSGMPCFLMMTFHHLCRSGFIELVGSCWCVTNGPLAYLWFNSELRADFLELIGLRKARGKNHMNTFVMLKKLGMKRNAVEDALKTQLDNSVNNIQISSTVNDGEPNEEDRSKQIVFP